ncbi:hypothetical protein HQN90_00630 [Paenibacillus alba]|nr:hypothetical protein [Paenibacillus alba]
MSTNKLTILALEEQTLMKQIEISEACLMAVLQVASKQNIDVHKLIVEDILLAIHEIQCHLQMELLHVRFTQSQQHKQNRD